MRKSMVRSIRISGKYTYILSESAYKSTGCGAESKFGIRIIGERVSAAVEDIAEDYRAVYDLFRNIAEEGLYPERLHKAVKERLSGRCPKIIPFRIMPDRPDIA